MGKKATIGIIVGLVLFGGVAWAVWRDRESPSMREVRHLQEQLLDKTTRETMTPEQTDAAWAELKQKAETLSDEEQAQLWQQYKEQAIRQKRAHLDRFFALKTKEERDAFLDKELDQWEQKKTAATGNAKQGRAAKAKGKGGGSEWKGPRDAQAQLDGLRKVLDSSSADERARSSAYYEALKARDRERGLSKK